MYYEDVNLLLTFSADDGQCSIQVFLIDTRTLEARASTAQIQQAARVLIQQCAPASGGIAVNIGAFLFAVLLNSKSMNADDTQPYTDQALGGDNNLAVVLSRTNNPDVRCYNTPSFPRPDACAQLISFVYADEGQLVWGPRGYPGVIVGLPATFIGESLTEHKPCSEADCWQT